MAVVVIETQINAPVEICFDLVRDVSAHVVSAAHTGEKAVAGVTSGHIGLGEIVTFEAVHFGIRQRLTAKVVEFDKPHRFVDEMMNGAFKSFKHVHEFAPVSGGTLLKDTLIWTAPFGFLGKIADKLFLENYMRNFVMRRNAKLKEAAEAI